jgi:hypothetical protein
MLSAARRDAFDHLSACHDTRRRPLRALLARGARRIVDAITEANERRAQRDIAMFLGQSGGKLTDALEREIARRLMAGGIWRR